MTAWGTFRPA